MHVHVTLYVILYVTLYAHTQTNLLFFVEKILSAIISSARSCPRLMCRIFSLLSQAAVRRFPGESRRVRGEVWDM